MYMIALNIIESFIHLFRVAQITTLQYNKAPIKVPAKHSNYADIFFFDLVIELLENTGINEYTIKLVEEK